MSLPNPGSASLGARSWKPIDSSRAYSIWADFAHSAREDKRAVYTTHGSLERLSWENRFGNSAPLSRIAAHTADAGRWLQSSRSWDPCQPPETEPRPPECRHGGL